MLKIRHTNTKQRPELLTVTLTWHTCKYKVHNSTTGTSSDLVPNVSAQHLRLLSPTSSSSSSSTSSPALLAGWPRKVGTWLPTATGYNLPIVHDAVHVRVGRSTGVQVQRAVAVCLAFFWRSSGIEHGLLTLEKEHTDTHTHTHTHTYMDACTHTCTHTHTYTPHTCMHTHTHTHTRTDTHTHRYTQINK